MRRSHKAGLVLAGIALAIFLFAVPGNHYWIRKPPEVANLVRLEQIYTACRLYAVDHSGRFPTHLGALSPDYLTSEALEKNRYEVIEKQRGTGVFLDWLYFGAGFDDTHPPGVLIAAPQVIDNHGQDSRIYVPGAGKSHVVAEEAYRKALAETLRQIPVIVNRRPAPPDRAPASVEPGQKP